MTSQAHGGTGRNGDARGIGDVVARARRDLELLIGRRADSISALRPSDDGWTISFEVVELERVPDSTSVLGTYETLVDGNGGLMSYERVRRYHRNQISEADG